MIKVLLSSTYRQVNLDKHKHQKLHQGHIRNKESVLIPWKEVNFKHVSVNLPKHLVSETFSKNQATSWSSPSSTIPGHCAASGGEVENHFTFPFFKKRFHWIQKKNVQPKDFTEFPDFSLTVFCFPKPQDVLSMFHYCSFVNKIRNQLSNLVTWKQSNN